MQESGKIITGAKEGNLVFPSEGRLKARFQTGVGRKSTHKRKLAKRAPEQGELQPFAEGFSGKFSREVGEKKQGWGGQG